jgi:hypothetical protein
VELRQYLIGIVNEAVSILQGTLKVVPQQGNLIISTSTCGSNPRTVFYLLQRMIYFNCFDKIIAQCKLLPHSNVLIIVFFSFLFFFFSTAASVPQQYQTNGIPNADFALFLTARPIPSSGSGSSVLAFASSCLANM